MTAAHLAGWLFADLLLVLFLVSLAAVPNGRGDAPPSPAPTPTSTPTRTRASELRGLNKSYCSFSIKANFGALLGTGTARTREERRVVNRLSAVLRGRSDASVLQPNRASCLAQLDDRPDAGVVIVYGVAPRADLDRAILVARRFAELTRRLPQFRTASSLSQWSGSTSTDSVEIIVFFYDT